MAKRRPDPITPTSGPLFINDDGSRMTEADVNAIMIPLMTRAGTPPHFIYAFQKTGMMVTEANLDQWSPEDLQEWEDAIDEYEDQQMLKMVRERGPEATHALLVERERRRMEEETQEIFKPAPKAQKETL